MADVELLPCPFCGDVAVDTGGLMPWVQCVNCDASGPTCDSAPEAISAWNDRASDTVAAALRSELAALKERHAATERDAARWAERCEEEVRQAEVLREGLAALRASASSDAVAHIAIERDQLQADLAALRRDRDDCLSAREHYAGQVGAMHGRVERFAEALRFIAEGNLGDMPGQENYTRIREHAQAALRDQSQEDKGG